MKYQNLGAFERHLEQAAKMSLSHVFLVVNPCSYERRKIVHHIKEVIESRGRPVHFLIKDATDGSLKAHIEDLNTLSLFSEEKVLYLNGIDKLKKGDLAALIAYVSKPSPSSYLLLGADSSKGLSDLYAKGKKELVACDLSEEKPWDLKNRLCKMLVDQAARSQKRLAPDAVDLLLDLLGVSLPHLEQEMHKLITYAIERVEITKADVMHLCAAQKTPHLFARAEQIVWNEEGCRIEDPVDLGLLLPLLAQVKSQLQQGMLVAVLRAKGVAAQEMTSYFPSLRPAALEKLLSPAKQRSIFFFKKALDLLFEAELMAKNSACDPSWILNLFQAKLHHIKSRHAHI